MNIYLTLDYELFLSRTTGSIDRCLIEPMNELCAIAKRYNVIFTIFVDAAYLYALKRFSNNNQVKRDYDNVCTNLQQLKKRGHEIQLHIHPQWFYANWNDEWILPQKYYKLSDLPDNDVRELFKISKELLEEIIQDKIIAFRAGGFSAQPTSLLRELFLVNNIQIDSSVYPHGFYSSNYQTYDYSNAPDKDIYRFDSDICIEDRQGPFIELPISGYKVPSALYWRYAFNRLIKSKKHLIYGNGNSVPLNNDSIVKRLTKRTDGLATIDGLKISYLHAALKAKINSGDNHFCILGHPKLATPYSLKNLESFCKNIPKMCSFSSISSLISYDEL